MLKKGKFKLLSYLIEEYLIFYKSQSKNKKLIAFAIIEIKTFNSLLSILKEFLKKQLITYFAFQLDVYGKNNKEVILNFEDSKKEQILKIFNIIQQKFKEHKIQHQFLSNKVLETRFMSILLEEKNSNVSVLNKSNSLFITNKKEEKLLDFYKLNLHLVETKNSFINSFLNLINSFKRKGYLFFNFKLGSENDIKIASCFVDLREFNETRFELKKGVNEFFNIELLEQETMKIKNIFNCLWRLGITDEVLTLENSENLFINDLNNTNSDFLQFINLFEEKLLKNDIKFLKLSKNLFFIDQQFVFLILNKLNSDFIYRIIENYHSKYRIYITILHESDYYQLLGIKSITQIEKIKILHPNEIQNLNYEVFKN